MPSVLEERAQKYPSLGHTVLPHAQRKPIGRVGRVVPNAPTKETNHLAAVCDKTAWLTPIPETKARLINLHNLRSSNK